MKNHKQLLADFYLQLLASEYMTNAQPDFCRDILKMLADELGEDVETVQRIFERMAAEDAKF